MTVADAAMTVGLDGTGIGPGAAVAAVPNPATAYAALTEVAHLKPGERVLVHGALGGLASAFPGVARTPGNASGDWQHTVATDSLWLGSLAIAGFSSGYYFPAHPGKSGPPPRAPSTPARRTGAGGHASRATRHISVLIERSGKRAGLPGCFW